MGFNDEQEKLRQAGEWLRLRPDSEQFKAAWEHVQRVSRSADPVLRMQASYLEDEAFRRFGYKPVQRGGNGRNGDGTWPATDGQGCPCCGAIRGGGHGGGCPNTGQYTEAGDLIAGTEAPPRQRPPSPWRPWEYPEYR
jgi:hypothetical protein